MRMPVPVLALAAGLAAASTIAGAADFPVPSAANPTMFDAITNARLSPDVDNTITVMVSPLEIFGTMTFDAAFGPGRRLVVRPNPANLRATIYTTLTASPMVRFAGAREVTFQDLDIVRNNTNASDLVVYEVPSSEITIQRCRLGSIWVAPGAAGMSIVRGTYPRELVIRNCILFAAAPATFDFGIYLAGFNDTDRSAFLYNNDVADYKVAGIRINDGASLLGSVVVLRNNVVANHPGIAPEPVCFVSEADGVIEIVASHNVVFASAGFGEVLVGAGRSIAGFGTGTVEGFARPAVAGAFVQTAWDLIPAWDPNPDFWRLLPGGILHDGAIDYGQDVGAASPHARDHAVTDDIERQGRPGGAPVAHNDRGADQVEPGVVLAVTPPREGTGLWAAPARNPAPTVAVAFRAGSAGRLYFEVHDLSGRRLHREERAVAAGESGTLSCRVRGAGGVRFYRVVLVPDRGAPVSVSGRQVILR